MTGDEEPIPDVSRRDALKKISIGAGIAWSAPVVLSFYNAAGAATGTPDNSTTTSAHTIPPTRSAPAPSATSTTGCSSNPDPTRTASVFDARPVCVLLRAGVNRCDHRSTVHARLQLPPGDVLRGQHLLPRFRVSLQRVHALLGRRGLHACRADERRRRAPIGSA